MKGRRLVVEVVVVVELLATSDAGGGAGKFATQNEGW
jgi:hypothetical protein